jgi:hypothetical protein
MSFDLKKILESKRAFRRKITALPIGAKLRILDDLRERALAIRAASRAHATSVREELPPYQEREKKNEQK